MVKTVYVNAEWIEEIELTTEAIDKLKNKKIALFASVQFLKLDKLRAQLKSNGCQILETKAKRTNAITQILGCDAYDDSFKNPILKQAEKILYVGDGHFHPNALLYSGADSIIIFDPLDKKTKVLTKEHVEKNEKKRIANIKTFMISNTIGILVSTKPGQQFLEYAELLKKKLEEQGKKSYLFLDNTFDYAHMENYPFIDCYVNTACPRIGMDDIVNVSKPLININEALNPEKFLT